MGDSFVIVIRFVKNLKMAEEKEDKNLYGIHDRYAIIL